MLFYVFFPPRNDAAQSDDDDKSQAPLADTDGGKLKQKTYGSVYFLPFFSMQPNIEYKNWLSVFQNSVKEISGQVCEEGQASCRGVWGEGSQQSKKCA